MTILRNAGWPEVILGMLALAFCLYAAYQAYKDRAGKIGR